MPNSSENEDERIPFGDKEGVEGGTKVPELNSPDSINDDLLNALDDFKSPRRLTTSTAERSKTSPSPYYYSDLLKKNLIEEERKQLFQLHQQPKTLANSVREKELAFKSKKSNSLEAPATTGDKESSTPPKRYSITEEGVRIIRCDSPSTSTSDDSDCSECQKRREWHSHALAVVRAATHNLRTQSSNDVEPEVDYQNSIVLQMPQSRFLLDNQAICACATPNFGGDDDQLFQPRSIFYVHQQGFQQCADCSITDDERLKALIFDEMNVRQRKIYETAFDSKIAKSDDDLDDVDRITKHSASLFGNEFRMVTSQSKDSFLQAQNQSQHPKEKRYRSKHSKKAQNNNNNNNNNVNSKDDTKKQTEDLIKDIESIKIEESIDNIVNANVTTEISAAQSTQYTPSPPSTAPVDRKFQTKHEKFFINSIKSAPNLPASPSNALQHPRLKDLRGSEKSDGVKERPRSVIIEAGRVFELKRSHSGRNYSSTESMATSSSGGSMESIRSSTSEGNRSTTSTESRHSSTLSSHSSDSGCARPLKPPMLINPKLQILSPISDKSAQEPVSENSENLKNQTPDGDKLIEDNIDKDVKKKRPAASKTLLLIARDEIQGSDSGISLHSRDDKAKLSALCDNKIDNATGLPQDLKDLPFDMPKLRRRRVQVRKLLIYWINL